MGGQFPGQGRNATPVPASLASGTRQRLPDGATLRLLDSDPTAPDALRGVAVIWLDSAGAGPALDAQAEAHALNGG